jgi:hypothetical protein
MKDLFWKKIWRKEIASYLCAPLHKKEASSLTNQSKKRFEKSLGVNGNTHIFAPAFQKSTDIITAIRDCKKSRIPFDRKLQRCIFAVLQKNQFLKLRNNHKRF